MNQITLSKLKTFAQSANGNINKIYLHWSAGHYHQFFDDYHLNIDKDGSIYASTDDLTEHKSHTYMRNTGAIGVALACCVGANSNDLGNESPTNQQIEAMAQVIAILCTELGLVPDIYHVLTHGEAGDNMDGLTPCDPYGMNTTCERWDLAILKNGDAWGSGGGILRGKAVWYQQN